MIDNALESIATFNGYIQYFVTFSTDQTSRSSIVCWPKFCIPTLRLCL